MNNDDKFRGQAVMIIQAEGITKHYRSVTAVKSVSLSAQSGQILALLGPNGAGKSSLIRILTGLTSPDDGRLIVSDGEREYSHVPEQLLGYLPEDRGLYLEKSLRKNLNYIAALRGISKASRQERIEHWLDYFELTDRADEPLSRLSKGNQQKVQLMATLLHDPEVVILDEPFSGLDPVNQEQVLTLLAELKSQGRLILLSAHQMALVERVADQMLLLDLGECIAQGGLHDVKAQLGEQHAYQVTLAREDGEQARTALTGVPGVTISPPDTNPDGTSSLEFVLSDATQLSAALQRLSAEVPVLKLDRQTTSLHQLYLQSIRKRRSPDTVEADQ
ncbi:ABC transporter ATP-binding protein [Marinimicrobium sp. ABcell2]|uniref:ABC transporter ATP-binding protein n=1 Tax=Marinimicrobium sp. ABcell2 TaxID=3069751 RepID=UPI0027B2F63C|nr:ATP-binding cassette domain-containing protein [Marinimicrobium sp. ABcell2]MDQ2075782.1 ATP-binding cassette domain-containing protein [Marinimicrobium sp. ABcell2]